MAQDDDTRGISRRHFNALAAGALGAATLPGVAHAAAAVGADGLHVEPWFIQSFLILSEDLEDADKAGKRLAIVWELEGCPYCREMHEVNFARKEITDYVKAHFNVLQLNVIGARKVTDFDGEELPEKKLAEKWGVRFTPTTIFLPPLKDLKKGVAGNKAEVARMPGYLKPFHFLTMYQYVNERAYEQEKFGVYAKKKIAALKTIGKSPENW